MDEALRLDLGKSSFEAYASETGLILEELNYHLRKLAKWARRERVRSPLVHFPASSFIYPQPYGKVLILGTWNYPLQIILLPLVGAISAGNCAVIKPSEFAPASANLLEEIIRDTFPAEYITVIQGASETGQELLNSKFDFIFFTGSPRVGKIVMESAAKNLVPVCLELGGKSPCIVEADADIKLAARRIIWGKLINAGQTCVAPDYVFVHHLVKDALVEEMKINIRTFFGEDPSLSPDYGRIINSAHWERLRSMMDGCRILEGGKVKEDERYIAPTIIDGVPFSHRLMQEEIFGPLLPLLEYEEISEVADFVNKRDRPLALYYFSKNGKNRKFVIDSIPCGGVCINETVTQFANIHLPVGGVGNSGMGSYHGEASFRTFSHYKSVLVKSTFLDVPFRYPPYSPIKMKVLRRFLG